MGEVDLELQTQEIEVPYPDSDSARLEITVRSAGRVNISGVSKDKFVEGTIEFDLLELKPKIRTMGDRVRIIQGET